jgi:hypothetical protein
MKIAISVADITLTAQLDDTPTARAIAGALPIEGSANVWGDEIYFEIPMALPLADDAVEEVDVGALAYWPTGSALCIFFGPTPVSTGEKPRAYSPVNVFGKIIEDATLLKKVTDGTPVRVTGLDKPQCCIKKVAKRVNSAPRRGADHQKRLRAFLKQKY